MYNSSKIGRIQFIFVKRNWSFQGRLRRYAAPPPQSAGWKVSPCLRSFLLPSFLPSFLSSLAWKSPLLGEMPADNNRRRGAASSSCSWKWGIRTEKSSFRSETRGQWPHIPVLTRAIKVRLDFGILWGHCHPRTVSEIKLDLRFEFMWPQIPCTLSCA